MSHAPERKEKDCLNCGTIIHGRFCHICGQENVVPKENFWKLVVHFFYDITHFDSKFFDTLRYLLFRPGFLPKEYMSGRRASYLNPIRMYIFTSAIFFLIFFAISGPENTFRLTDDEPFSRAGRDSMITILKKRIGKDTATVAQQQQLFLLSDTTREVRPSDLYKFAEDFIAVGTIGGDYRNRQEYDSVQQSLPAGKRDNWLQRLWNQKAIGLNEKYKQDPSRSNKDIANAILHRLPYLLFVSLPFFALILKLLYIRRKQFYYADHGIFAVNHYILSFILLLFVFLWNKLQDLSGWGIWNFMITVTVIAWPLYLLLAMKRFYGQGWGKTFVKFILLNLVGLIVQVILLVIFSLFSIFQL
ncbi:MAG: DUF3667 domain-containing protein [Chitinophagaceae bacterium]|nr:DUF3667 domain-containing protein [Chitinophagaceae bacterium]